MELIGHPRFWIDARPLLIKSRKAEALLGYLSLCPGNAVARATVTGLLWGDKPEPQARASLRQTIHLLNKLFQDNGFTGFVARKSEILLLPDGFRSDILELLRAVTDGEALPPMLLEQTLAAEQILAGFDDLGEPYSVWLRVQRQTLHDRIRIGLEQRLAQAGDADERLQLSHALLNVDPSHEPACRVTMEIRARRGDQAGALNAYNNLYRYLDENFDSEPTEQTQQLVAEIKLGELTELPAEPAALPATVGASADPIVVPARFDVRPRIIIDDVEIASLSGSKSFVASVFRHDLISRMVRFREWSVLDKFPSAGETAETPTYRLTSSGYVSDDKVKLSLALRDMRNGDYVWGYNYEIDADSVFELQQQIVAQIALGVNVHVSQQQLARSQAAPIPSLDHYHRWLLAQSHHFKHLPADFEQAVAIYRTLVEEQPSFAPAYSSYAQTLNSRHLVYVGEHRSQTTLERARLLAQSAQNIDPFDSRSHLCAAWNAMLTDRFNDAESHLRMAYDLNENDPWTVASVATGLAFCGRTDLAKPMALRAQELGFLTSPVQWGYFTGLWFLCGDYEAAVEAYRKCGSGFFYAMPWGIAALAELGESAAAVEDCEALLDKASKRWTLDEPANRKHVADWLAQCFPVADAAARDHLIDGLAGAGLESE